MEQRPRYAGRQHAVNAPRAARRKSHPRRRLSWPAGSGRLFSCDLCDESGEIRATGFNDCIDAIYEKLEEGKVYIFTGGKIKPANKKYSQLANNYEITFNDNTTAEEVSGATDIPEQQVCRGGVGRRSAVAQHFHSALSLSPPFVCRVFPPCTAPPASNTPTSHSPVQLQGL